MSEEELIHMLLEDDEIRDDVVKRYFQMKSANCMDKKGGKD